jgi:hypothetical protein
VDGLGDVAYVFGGAISSGSEVAHHHPRIVVLGLRVEGDDLRSYFEMGDGIVVAAGYLCAQGVYPEEAAPGVVDELVLLRLLCLLTGQTGALAALRLAVLYSSFGLEKTSDLAHLGDGQEERIGHAPIEVFLPLRHLHHVLLEFLVPLLEYFAGKVGLGRGKFGHMRLDFSHHLFPEGSDLGEFRICLDDDFASKFLEGFKPDGVFRLVGLVDEEYAFQ